ncbi:MAG TPA: EVE domain-containing protein [Thermoanaerobaculia bacterium]|nr:EVE domain-containing protein [Thermoanaerobaculia bacterium]
MRYWVIKGNPYSNDWDRMLVPGNEEPWHTGRIPKDWENGDRLFCWESAPALRVVGLAELTDRNAGVDQDGDRLFRVRYITRKFSWMPTIADLRAIPILNEASFLKTGPATTLFPLTSEQASLLFALLASGNVDLGSQWQDIAATPWAGLVPDLDWDAAVREGGIKLISHFARERNRTIVDAKKRAVLASVGNLACEICQFDFGAFYPDIGDGYCEVHHLVALSESPGAVETRLSDLAVVCSNCHRMLHRKIPFMKVEKLRTLLQTGRHEVRSSSAHDDRAVKANACNPRKTR